MWTDSFCPLFLLFNKFHALNWRCLGISNLTHQINEQIRDREVRLIGEDGEQLGIVTSKAALETAMEKDLDLVMISPKAQPPVCRIMDYGKYRFEQSKREKEAKKNQHLVELKEIRMSPGIDSHDLEFKCRNAKKFLEDGNKVKVTVRFRGRAIAHSSLGEQLLIRFSEILSESAIVEKAPKLEGRNMSMFLAPKVVKPEKQ